MILNQYIIIHLFYYICRYVYVIIDFVPIFSEEILFKKKYKTEKVDRNNLVVTSLLQNKSLFALMKLIILF